MYSSIQKIVKQIENKISQNNLEAALYKIQSFVEQIIYMPKSAGHVISSIELDNFCQQIGAKIKTENPVTNAATASTDLIVYVASQLYSSGGHTAVIEDFIKYQPDKKYLILLTDIFQSPHRKSIEKRFGEGVKFEWAPTGSLVKKVQWLQQRLAALQPEKTFLFNHHQDSIAIAAMQPGLVPELYFFHHADHHLCLGVHLKYALHLDAQSLGFRNCREQLGITNNVYWPLVAPDQGIRPKDWSFMAGNKLVTCSSGSPMKFESAYLYSYSELVPKILAVTGGKHIHIGKLSPRSKKIIARGLKQQGISPEQFMHIPWVKSVWQTVIEQRVDIYLSSFPISGGRATIEILGAGIPIIMHENYRSEYLGQVYMAYPQAFYWQKPEELLTCLTTLTPEILQQHSEFARTHFERYHSPNFLREELAKIGKDVKGLTPPSLPVYKKNELQVFLEHCNDVTIVNVAKKYLMTLVFSNSRLMFMARRARRTFKNLIMQ